MKRPVMNPQSIASGMALVAILLPALAPAQAPPPIRAPSPAESARVLPVAADSGVTLEDFAWLEGTWRGAGPDGTTAEIHYMAPLTGVLPSVFRLWRGDKVLLLEVITLVQQDTGITLHVRHFTPALEPLEAEHALTLQLVAREGDRFIFQNTRDENPRRTVLERTAPDGFRSWSELRHDDGTTGEIRVEYRRVPAPHGPPGSG